MDISVPSSSERSILALLNEVMKYYQLLGWVVGGVGLLHKVPGSIPATVLSGRSSDHNCCCVPVLPVAIQPLWLQETLHPLLSSLLSPPKWCNFLSERRDQKNRNWIVVLGILYILLFFFSFLFPSTEYEISTYLIN